MHWSLKVRIKQNQTNKEEKKTKTMFCTKKGTLQSYFTKDLRVIDLFYNQNKHG